MSAERARRKAMQEIEMKKAGGGATLIFDGSCPICSGTVKWIHENELEGSFEMLPCQAASIGEQFPGVQRAECMKAMHLVLPDGTVLVGEKALPEIFTRLKAYRVFAPLFKIPGTGVLSRIAYRWFADRRYRIAAFLAHLRNDRKSVS
jgi:predicted DCC family thiol-disulfide oxidoreductase YuxK